MLSHKSFHSGRKIQLRTEYRELDYKNSVHIVAERRKKKQPGMEQTEQVNKVKLITTNVSSFIPFFWILKRNQEASVIREILNIPIYLWNINTIVDYKFSLHFLVYMAKYLTTPSCCNPEKNPYMLGWVSNAMMQKIE